MGLSLVTAPTVEPLGLEETKVHLRVDGDDHDTYVNTLIVAARNHVENLTRRRLVQQTWDYTLPRFPNSEIELPIQPVSSITSVSYINGSGVSTAFTDFTLIKDGPRAKVVRDYNVSWPTTREHGNAVTVRFVAGYEPSTDSPQDMRAGIPSDIREAMKLMVGDMFENRESTSQLRMSKLDTFDTLISSYILRDF